MLEERQLITRDMHDGLESQLLSTIRMAQDPAISKESLYIQLRETLDHLKLTVDAMQDTEGDIGALLGSIRYRLGPRLAAAGIELLWSVNSLPSISRWSLQNSRDLQMILFEAFSNMITHAAASHAQLQAKYDTLSDAIHILLQDDGCGFDMPGVASFHGHGLVNMRSRADSLRAQFAISSLSPGFSALEPASSGTRIALTIACMDMPYLEN
jgi:signal transduction histidine kinase